ncbi:hypothetical protein [Pseudomonas meliae]|uniref:Putative DNA-methylase n=1 Tax=Pseudomonas meliae TaxID=86176 RepID=A0A0P9UTK2_9PSED|nr:hypothetical protein [Pseudomonas meliae]KPX92227.1 putative DNA-methylase [Pseudomonas meliae]
MRADRAIARWASEIQRRDAGTKPEFEFSANGKSYRDADKERLAAVFATAMKRAVERRSEDTFQRAELVPVGKYRGFDVQVSCERQKIHFTVTGQDSYEPDNLVYRVDDKFSISGFISRMDNFLEHLEGWSRHGDASCQSSVKRSRRKRNRSSSRLDSTICVRMPGMCFAS